ncbi:MAG: response regulator transcription factor [Bacteroidota bacterium]
MSENNIIKIAIAEDQRLFRACLIPILNDFEHLRVILEASNGRELLQKMETTTEAPDVIIMDLSMPEMDGLETTQQVKARFPNAKIIILSVHSEERHIVKMVGMGINGYLVKNSELEEVRLAIESVHSKGFYFNDAILKAIQTGMRRQKQKNFVIETSLTGREKEILQLICQELTTQEIAERLFISVRTVDGHRNNLLEKTGSRNTAGLVLYAIKNSLIEFEV